MATHSSVLPCNTPWTEESGRLPSIGSHRVEHNLSDQAAAAAGVRYSYSQFLKVIFHLCCFSC